MKTLAALCLFVFATLAAATGSAQQYPMGPAIQEQPGFESQNGQYDQSGQYDPNAPYDPNNPAPAQQPDLTQDDAVAQSYDDGYDPQAYTQFENALSPYGSWVDDGSYGRVWVPSAAAVGGDFSPYATGGQWAFTEYGWTWVSDWDWGWAPFHYGRWAVLNSYGWCWVPGTIWGPAWVSWRAGGGYVGWAPLPPRGLPVARPFTAGSPWRFATSATLGSPGGSYFRGRAVAGVFARTTVVANTRALAVGGTTVHVNAGPAHAAGGWGHAGAAPRLAVVAPHALPRFAIQPRAGAPLVARPWARGAVAPQQPGFRGSTPVFAAPQRGYPASRAVAPTYAPAAAPRFYGAPANSGGHAVGGGAHRR